MDNEFEKNNNEIPEEETPEVPTEDTFDAEIPQENYDAHSDNEYVDIDDDEPIDLEDGPEFTVTHSVKKKSFLKTVALVLVCGLVLGAGFGFANGIVKRLVLSRINIESTELVIKKAENGERAASDVALIAENCMPSVVAITNKSVSDVITFFGTYSQESTSSGSGIVIGRNDSELLIVTNYHVVANAKELSVVFSSVENRLEMQSDGKGAASLDDEAIPSAVVKGYDATKDLAVIAVELDDIPKEVLSEVKIAVIGDSSSLRPGDQVVAIGNSLGYGQSVTTGIISAVNRKITMQSSDGVSTVTNSFIQTDAAINQGNSGGALLDMNGNVIGINSVKIATTGVEGMGYAIPITDVESIIGELMTKKTRSVVDEKKQGFLGITGSDVSASTSEMYGIPVGVFVNSVEPGLAAEKAGIKRGYVITKFDGYTVSTISQLQDRLRYYEDGEKVKVTVEVPNGSEYEEKVIEVSLSNRSKNMKEE